MPPDCKPAGVPTAALKPANPTLKNAVSAKRCSTRPACLFIRRSTQSRSRQFAASENERRPKDAAPSQFRTRKDSGVYEHRMPHCGTQIEPKDYKRVDWEHLECPECGKTFRPSTRIREKS